LGHPNFKITQIPARDGIPHGSIKRSNIHPNNTFFTNWITEKDSISWNVDVLKEGNYNVTVYYTLPQDAQGTILHLQQGKNILSKRITLSHDPPLKGMENDRVPRMESYVKQFIPLTLGNITLDKGRQPLVLKATDLKNDKGPDIRLLLFERQD
jgi:hypothetical protein